MTIAVKGKDYQLRQSFRALMVFEQLTGKNAYQISSSITDTINLFWCMLSSANPDFDITIDAFIALLDDRPELLEQFNTYLLSFIDNTPEKAVTNKKKEEKR